MISTMCYPNSFSLPTCWRREKLREKKMGTFCQLIRFIINSPPCLKNCCLQLSLLSSIIIVWQQVYPYIRLPEATYSLLYEFSGETTIGSKQKLQGFRHLCIA